MLKKLYVRNYALIKELELDFDSGLTIITGETGAGKSIILGALGLILGNRADSSALLDKNVKCIVEGTFTIRDKSLKSFFEINELDFSEEAVLRREVSPNGRSRAFINDTPVTLDLLKELCSEIIDIHSQHQALMLGKNDFQLAVLDSFADHDALLENYHSNYITFRKIQKEYRETSARSEQEKADFDYFNHQLQQLDDARLQPGEEKEMEEERDLLMHAGEVHEALVSAISVISREDNSVVPGLSDIRRLIERIEDYLPDSKLYIQRLNSVIIELNDLANEIEVKSESVEADPGRLEMISSRLDIIYSLLHKHRVESVSELVETREKLRKRVDEISLSDERIEKLSKQLSQLEMALKSLSSDISFNRREVIAGVEEEMDRLLKALGMPNAKFEVELSRLDDFSPGGADHVDFKFSANKQIVPENIAKVASGGELSRVMLSLKSLLSDNNKLPTIFFDEIDSGVSGDVATKVGQILSLMGEKMQVINITHLPQVAAHATLHYKVYKEDEGDSTITRIKLLDKNERLNEVARLLSGNEITTASIENAKELINGV
jgi:DNA repair protein RecN (Recombination protein N)